MNKNINYKYLNLLILIAIIYMILLMKQFIFDMVINVYDMLLPFIVSFLIAYSLYPITEFLRKKKMSMLLAVIITIITVFLLIFITLYCTIPLLYNQLIYFLSVFDKFFDKMMLKYDIDFINIKNIFSSFVYNIIGNIDKNKLINIIVSFFNKSISYISNIIIVFILTFCFLLNMEKIRNRVNKFLRRFRTYEIIKSIDREAKLYLKGFLLIMIIQFFEYTIIFFIIGHPNYLVLGLLASITTIIPIFGGLFTNLIALIIAFMISKKLFILTIIITMVFPNIDSYIINPKVYNKTNKIPTFLTIISVVIGSKFGIIGIILSVPITIVIMVFIKNLHLIKKYFIFKIK